MTVKIVYDNLRDIYKLFVAFLPDWEQAPSNMKFNGEKLQKKATKQNNKQATNTPACLVTHHPLFAARQPCPVFLAADASPRTRMRPQEHQQCRR